MWTGALVGAIAVLAGAPVQTGSGVTLVDVVLTVVPGEARRTYACEGVDAVHTRATIEAGAARGTITGLKFSVAYSVITFAIGLYYIFIYIYIYTCIHVQ